MGEVGGAECDGGTEMAIVELDRLERHCCAVVDNEANERYDNQGIAYSMHDIWDYNCMYTTEPGVPVALTLVDKGSRVKGIPAVQEESC